MSSQTNRLLSERPTRQEWWETLAGTYLGILRAVLLLVAVAADGVIIKAGVFDQPHPLAPPRRDVAAVVLVEVLAEETCRRKKKREYNK